MEEIKMFKVGCGGKKGGCTLIVVPSKNSKKAKLNLIKLFIALKNNKTI